jgi:hypothetical protein
VADVNVQNVSQGLSAALYSGGPSQPGMNDGGDAGQQQAGGGQNAPRDGNVGNVGQGDPGHDRNGSGDDDSADDFVHPHAKQHHGPRGRGQDRGHNRGQGGQQYGNSYPQSQGGNGNVADPKDRVPPPPARVADEQPDYPEQFLPVGEAVAASEPGHAPRETGDDRPRNRLRGRRPRHVAGEPAEGSVVNEAGVTTGEDSE